MNFLGEIQTNQNGVKFSELFKIKTGIATLADKVFIIDSYNINNGLISFTKQNIAYEIEESITKKCVKASKYKDVFYRIIYPYKNINGRSFGYCNGVGNAIAKVIELRIGGEYRIKAVSLRAGYRSEKSPYTNQSTIGNLTGYSSGFGYNFGGTKLDITYSHSQRNYQKQFFNVGMTDYSNINSVMNNIIISMTFEF